MLMAGCANNLLILYLCTYSLMEQYYQSEANVQIFFM